MAAGNSVKATEQPVCPKCKSKHKPGTKCTKKDEVVKNPPVVHGHLTLNKITTRDQLNEYITKAKTAAGKCPACSKPHTFERKFDFGKVAVPSHRLSSCPSFKTMTEKQR